MSSLRDFRRPRLWLGAWLFAIVTVIVFSLTPPPRMSVPHNFDKVEHLTSYGVLSIGAVLLFATWRARLRAAAGLVLLGIALEFAQALLTTTRSGDPLDAAANTTGVLLGLLLAFTPAARWLQRLDARLPTRR